MSVFHSQSGKHHIQGPLVRILGKGLTSPMVQWLRVHVPIVGSIPGLGAKIPHVSMPKKQNTEQKQYCIKFNKAFKNGPH